MANPRRAGVIVEIGKAKAHSFMIGGAGLTPCGPEMIVVLEDLTIIHTFTTTVDGYAWQWLDAPPLSPTATAALYDAAMFERAEKMAEKDRKQHARRDAEDAFTARILAKRPPWAKAIIVAVREIDDSDPMTDYHATKDGQRVLLAWSKHTRDLFPEMRKAAQLCEQTKHLATAGPEVEHREKYSMGAGYYLKAEGRYNTGWMVHKHRLWWSGELKTEDIAYLYPAEDRLPA